MLTRIGVARRLGKSLATVRRMEDHQLHPHIDGQGVHWFDEDEVDALATEGSSRREPAIATRRSDAPRSDAPRSDARRSAMAEGVLRHRQREIDLKNAEERYAALKAELDAAQARIDALVEERRKMRSVLRTLGRLILDTFDQKTLRHVDSTLLAVIRASASDVD